MSNEQKISRIKQFLLSRNWIEESSKANYLKFRAPRELADDYVLTVPIESLKSSDEYINRIVENLSIVYDTPPEQFYNIFLEKKNVLSFQIIGDETSGGNISLIHFENVIDRIKKTLLDVASFVISDEQSPREIPLDAITYLENCKFLQTEVGSFVTNISIPSGINSQQNNLFDDYGLLNFDDINIRLESILELVTKKIFKHDMSIYEDDFVENSMDLLCVSALENIYDIYSKSGADQINIKIIGEEKTNSFESGFLSAEKIENFDGYVRYIREHLVDNINVNVTGKVVELRSYNPASKKNYVRISTGEYGGSFIAVVLDNQQYAEASSAHITGRSVHILGRARKMKTQIKVIELISFVVL